MSESLPAIDGARPRWRGLVTTIMLVLISVMIVRDILIRRWAGALIPSPPPTETTLASVAREPAPSATLLWPLAQALTPIAVALMPP